MFDLTGKKALITGASRGIGKAISQQFYQLGCQVALNCRNREDLAPLVSEMPGCIGIDADVTNSQQAKNMVDKSISVFGDLDIVVCNVGSGSSVPPGHEDYQEWQRVFGINFFSTTNTVEAAKQTLIRTKGVVLCISSICGLEVIPGAPVTYSAAKAALHAYVRGMARPLGESGVRINAIAAGNILHPGSVWARKLEEDASAVNKMLNANVATRSLGEPLDIASLSAFLVSAEAKFATGAVYTLDGGQVRS